MNTLDQINLESSLLGFCSLHKDVVFYNDHGIVMRNDENFANNKSRVMIISGGGAGHEPGMGIGFVGRGMLDSVVCGNIFTSPSVMR